MPPDICPIGERPLLLPPNLLTKLTTMQWQRATWHPLWVHISFQSLLKLSTTPGPGVPHLHLPVWTSFLLSIPRWRLQYLPGSSVTPLWSPSVTPSVTPSLPSQPHHHKPIPVALVFPVVFPDTWSTSRLRRSESKKKWKVIWFFLHFIVYNTTFGAKVQNSSCVV